MSIADDYHLTFSSAHGRRVLLDMMAKFHLNHSSFHRDPHVTAFREGERNSVLYILTMLNMTERDLALMIAEREDEARKVREAVGQIDYES
jgi:hypothetical protein